MKKKINTISENTLMNVETALEDGRPRTCPQIAKKIKRDPATVYRALGVLQKKGKADSLRVGRQKLYFRKKAIEKMKEQKSAAKPTPPQSAGKVQIEAIKVAVKELLQKKGPLQLIQIVKTLAFPRSSTYAAVAEMKRNQVLAVMEDGRIGIAQIPIVVPGPEPMEDTPTGDLPPPPESPASILSGLAKAMTERALEEVLGVLVDEDPTILEKLQKRHERAAAREN